MPAGFDDLVFMPTQVGVGAKHYFSNGFGVSVVKSQYSYGGTRGLYELALLDTSGNIISGHPVVPDGVLGWLRPEDVTDLMHKIVKKEKHYGT